MRTPRRRLLAALPLVLAACDPSPGAGSVPPSPAVATSPAPTASPKANPAHPVSLPALMTKEFDGRGLRVGRVLLRTAEYTKYFVTYRSGRLRISGIMNVPDGTGPFPVLVLGHGYIDPDIYVNGQGLRREQDYLARAGYVVLHTDYRGHAASDDDPKADLRLRLGYTEDVVNAVRAIRGSSLPYIDRDRIGLVARSMGGGVALNVAVVQPKLVDAIVVFAPVSSDAVDNYNRWTRRPQRRALAKRIADRFGSPEENPVFWRNVSPRTFFDRVEVPILIHHGTRDESVPYRWTRETLAALERAGKDARLFTYEGEAHAFGPQWPKSMRRTVAFLDRHLTAG